MTSPIALVAAQICPRAIPPSLGGTRCGQYGWKPARPQPIDDALSEVAILKTSAAQCDLGLTEMPGDREDRFHQHVMETGRDQSGRGRCRRSSSTARTAGSQSITSGAVCESVNG